MKVQIQDKDGNLATAIYSNEGQINTTDLDQRGQRSSVSGLGEWRMEETNSPLRRRGEDSRGRLVFLDSDNREWKSVDPA